MTPYITYSLVTLTMDGVMSFSKLMDVQSVRKNSHYSQNMSYGKFEHSVQDGGIFMDSEGLSYFKSFCVLDSK